MLPQELGGGHRCGRLHDAIDSVSTMPSTLPFLRGNYAVEFVLGSVIDRDAVRCHCDNLLVAASGLPTYIVPLPPSFRSPVRKFWSNWTL